MAYKNPKELLLDATKFPAAVEAALPEGAPKISTMLLDAADKIPVDLPDFVVEVPALPAPPELPAITPPTTEGGLRLPQFITGAKVTPVQTRQEVRGVSPLISAGERLPREFILVDGERVPVSVT